MLKIFTRKLGKNSNFDFNDHFSTFWIKIFKSKTPVLGLNVVGKIVDFHSEIFINPRKFKTSEQCLVALSF